MVDPKNVFILSLIYTEGADFMVFAMGGSPGDVEEAKEGLENEL